MLIENVFPHCCGRSLRDISLATTDLALSIDVSRNARIGIGCVGVVRLTAIGMGANVSRISDRTRNGSSSDTNRLFADTTWEVEETFAFAVAILMPLSTSIMSRIGMPGGTPPSDTSMEDDELVKVLVHWGQMWIVD